MEHINLDYLLIKEKIVYFILEVHKAYLCTLPKEFSAKFELHYPVNMCVMNVCSGPQRLKILLNH